MNLGTSKISANVLGVSPEDNDLLDLWWVRDHKGYLMRRPMRINRRVKFLHRVVLSRKVGRELLPHEHCDHIDRNKMNNTRSNLRIVTISENNRNLGMRKGRDVRGVYRVRGKWLAKAVISGKQYTNGVYTNKEDAAAAAAELRKKLGYDW